MGRQFNSREEVDFVIVGSGAAGGVMARELSQAGYDVVVLEQGPYLQASDFGHDELETFFNLEWMGGIDNEFPQTYRLSESEEAVLVGAGLPVLIYARMVGGSSVHFTGNYWRFHPIDFTERSLLGEIPNTGFDDWPITYDDLEPYYTKVDWEIGVSGIPGPFDPPRSRPFPVPPLPVKSSGVLMDKGARALGLHSQPAPMAILSEAYQNRPGCVNCGFCLAFGCEVSAKSSTLATMIPQAEATGRCEIRSESTVVRLDTGENGQVKEVMYLDKNGVEHAQKAKAFVICANGAETARLLLHSESSRHPNGLANSSGKVGKYLMFNTQIPTMGLFEHPLNEYKGVQVTRIIHDYYNADLSRGFYGGGGLDARFQPGSPLWFALQGLPADAPRWGKEHKRILEEYYTHTMSVAAHGTSLPLESNTISLDPTHEDKWGRPAIRVTYNDHPDDLSNLKFLQDVSVDVLEAAGAKHVWTFPIAPTTVGAHLLGTCRMGNDPDKSVIDRFHRTHDVRNLFIADGSSLVTSGRGQPTMTIQALAFRAAEHISGFAARNEL